MARRDTRPDPKEAALAGARCLNPHPEQVTDPEFVASDFFDARDAVQVKYEMVRKVGPRRPGHRGRRGVRLLPPRVLRRGRRTGVLRAGRACARAARAARGQQLTEEILAWAEEQLASGPACARPSCRTGSRRPSACACTPGRSSERWPAAGSATPKAADLPPPQERRMTRPCPCSHHLATRLLNQAQAWMPARTVPPAACWTPATSNCVMPPCTRAPRRSRSGSAC